MGNHRPANEIEGLPEYSRFPVHRVPFFLQVNHIHSAFVEVRGDARGRPVRALCCVERLEEQQWHENHDKVLFCFSSAPCSLLLCSTLLLSPGN